MTSHDSTALYTCAKCDGKGTIRAFSHVHGGACFPCGGTGKVELTAITDSELLQNTVTAIEGSANAALEAVQDGDWSRAEYLLEGVISEMFKIGSDRAREILDFIAAGEWFNGASMTEGQVSREDAVRLRAWVIARGRRSVA
jgi:RecJ-like exonuclease